MKYYSKSFLAITLSLLIISCVGGGQLNEDKKGITSSPTNGSAQLPSNTDSPAKTDDTVLIKTLRNDILTSIKSQDYQKLAGYFHADSGVRFSPFAFVNTAKDVQLSAAEFKDAIKSNTKFTWGFAAGSGNPIELTIPEYFKKYVYNVDFLNAAKTSVNEMIGVGNSLNNLKEVYPNAHYTENYDPGKNEMAWTTLRLVFNKKGEQFYLVGIIHDRWTP